ncbi:hypothetical protein PR048_002946 [Dryococelus australis]|uniref:Uncharacterized protein n=1 Tax=Dryococelus australis TaxID=614101 RepID=A0ABQ9ILP6_9NEOP|nr:hypothetical protein PR048_002946 [Dryococelus australis]
MPFITSLSMKAQLEMVYAIYEENVMFLSTNVLLMPEYMLKEVAIYCNSCLEQNKNRQMLATVFCFLNNSRHVSVSISYLILGHMYMPYDYACMNALILSQRRKPPGLHQNDLQ